VKESPKTSNWRSHIQPPPSPVLPSSHNTFVLMMKVLNIDWPSLVKHKVSTHKWPLGF
jgi:hypothetical protein